MNTVFPLSLLTASKLNPRQHFDDAGLAELTSSIAQHGVLTNLIVRPIWCVGLITQEDLAAAKAKNEGLVPASCEIVSGERRARAAQAYLDAGAGSDMAMPVLIKPMTDPEVLAINLTEQMQRNQLTPLEEAEAFHQMLAYKGTDGAALHTAESLAASVGKAHDYVLARLKLRVLPAALKKALDADKVPFSVGELIARVPDPAAREEAAQLAMTGGRDGSVMTVAEVKTLLEEKFMVQLKGAPFNQEDAGLVPAAGKCSACPHRSGNIAGLVKGRGARTDMCTHPTCYREKCQAAFLVLVAEANAKGITVLTDKDSARHFETHRPAEVRIDSDWVELDTKPMAHLLKAEVKNPPTWRALVDVAAKAGMAPEIVLAKDGTGRGRWLVNSALLISASEKFGEPIFKGQKGDEPAVAPRAGEDADDTFKRGKREHAEQVRKATEATAAALKLRDLVNGMAVQRVHAALTAMWVVQPIWSVMADLISLNLIPGQWVVQKALATKETDVTKLSRLLGKQTEKARQALVPLLLGSDAIMREGLEARCLQAFARLTGVDLKAIVGEATAAQRKPVTIKAGKKKAKPVPKKKPAKKAGKGGAK